MNLYPVQCTPHPIDTLRAFEDRGALARSRFLARIDTCISEAGAAGHRLALFLVGLDRPGQRLGSLEPEAEAALRARAEARLAGCAAQDGAAARLRDDIFGLLLPRMRSGLQAREAATRILCTLGFPYRARIGIAVFPGDGRNAAALIGCAATALARARREARPTYCFYLRAFATSTASSSPVL